MTLQDRLRRGTDGMMSQIGRVVWSWGVHPDTITLAGLLITVIASLFLLTGRMQLAGIILLVGLPLDALDGAVARAMNQPQRKFGGVLDSTLDRYADGVIFGTLMLFYASSGQTFLAMACMFTLVGSFTTSYVRSRAGLAGVEVKIGLIDRLVRVVLLLVGLLLPATLPFVLVGLAIASNITTAQRLDYARRHMD